MKLNEHIPGLPEWPAIERAKEENEYIVGGKHVSYGRYMLAQWILRLAAFAGFIILGKWAFKTYQLQEALMVLLLSFVPYIIIVSVLPLAKWLCLFLFPRDTRIRFTPQHVTINGKKYSLASNVTVQFRANRPRLSPSDCNQTDQKKHVAYLLGFRKLEMVYGARIVCITTIDNPDRAEQFTIALQAAYILSNAPQAGLPGKLASRNVMEDNLPE